jgi:hypothetical protein
MSQPAHKIRIGTLQVTIWRNHGEKGNWYSVIPSRGYKQEDAWKETESVGFDDLLTMSKRDRTETPYPALLVMLRGELGCVVACRQASG